jgi:hypothetical protein
VEVVLLTSQPDAVDFRLQTPNGLLLEPWRARAEPAMRYETGDGVAYFRLALPLQLRPNRFDQAGTWHAILTIGRPQLEATPEDDDGVDLSILRGRRSQAAQSRPQRRPFEFERAFAVTTAASAPSGTAAAALERDGRIEVPYSVVVHAYSHVSLRAQVGQQSFQPGAEAALTATLTQSGVPVDNNPYVWAEITRPDATVLTVPLDSTGPAQVGEFGATFAMALPGVYRVRVRARGRTRAERPYTREQTLTTAVWLGGDDPQGPNGPRPAGSSGSDSLCTLLSCLLNEGALDERLLERLTRLGIDVDRARRCLSDCGCGHRASK